ncbi:hypothetical protein GCM10027429_18870 [Marivirga atlantica]|jgi:hypothetical protein|uniref:SusF/SusE family outer membrane protein n=1 Tax=Marivirga atlantica TaxID=1548457 RepID=A0A937AH83_9BACT|nr:SusF/SusE family outer membrane protein [Marivirga atlantica]MBL0765504.1 SusF/SusE family outer membrane protein [Marivirga atlantica]
MKKLIYVLFIGAFITFSACEDENISPEFMVDINADSLMFQNDFQSTYYLSDQTEDNVAERFVWNELDLGVATNLTYELYASVNEDMSASVNVATTANNNAAVTVAQMLVFADSLGLDDDPTTTVNDEPNNTGTVYFRARGFVGTQGTTENEKWTNTASLEIEVIEKVNDGACPSLWAVGDGVPAAGWNWNSPIELTCENNVYSVRVELVNDIFRFFENEGDWDSGLNYQYFVDQGYTIDENFELNADDADNNFRFVGTPGIYELIIDEGNKTITLTDASGSYFLVGDGTQAGWNWDNPVELVQEAPYIYSGSVTLSGTGAFRVFTEEGNWDSGRNYPYYNDEGYTINSDLTNAEDGDSNFSFTGAAGTYTFRLDEVNKTIELE